MTALVNGFEVKVEPKRLNLLEEVQFRLEGARIFQTLGIGRIELQPRTAYLIAKDDPRAVVLVEHNCERLIARAFEDFFAKPNKQEMEF